MNYKIPQNQIDGWIKKDIPKYKYIPRDELFVSVIHHEGREFWRIADQQPEWLGNVVVAATDTFTINEAMEKFRTDPDINFGKIKPYYLT